jgi:Tol biopolymer transport system component
MTALGATASLASSWPASSEPGPSTPSIGYTRYQTNLPGGRCRNIVTMRAWVVQADGQNARPVAEELTRESDTWTQFTGWSPGGRMAIIGRGWESPENGAWEEEHNTFRQTEGTRYDMYLLDMEPGTLRNLTEVERVSEYNTGLFFMPGDGKRLGFQALIGGKMHPFSMDLDGRNKRDLTNGNEGFTYGFSASPDGKRISYHKDYQAYVANADGSGATKIETGHPFNFGPTWSPDGGWVMFLSGEHHDCDPYASRADGTGLRKVGSRNGYKGWVAILDVRDFHDGSSDTPVWARDGKGVFFAAQVGTGTQILWTSVEGETRQLTHTPDGVLNYQPQVSRDGRWLIFGSNRTGARQLYVRTADPSHTQDDEIPVTHVEPGWATMWPAWRCAAR